MPESLKSILEVDARKVFLFEKPRDQDELKALTNELDAAVSALNLPRYDLLPERVTKPYLLSVWVTEQGLSARMSRYRLLCRSLSRLRHGVVFINDAHLLSGASIQLLAQLLRHVNQDDLDWRFVFIANHEHKNFLHLQSLNKDFQVSYGAGFSPDKPANGPVRLSRYLAFFCFLLVIAVAGYFFLDGLKLKRVITIDESESISEEVTLAHDKTAVLVDTGSNAQLSELDAYLSKLAEKEALFEQDLQRIKAKAKSVRVSPEKTIDTSSNPQIRGETVVSRVGSGMPVRSITRPQAVKLKPAQYPLSKNMVEMIVNGDVDGLRALALKNEQFDGRGENGESALIASVTASELSVVELMLEFGVNTEYVDRFGRTALYYAAIQGNVKIITALINADADLDARTDLNKTALMAAVHNRHVASAKYLLERGAELNLQDHSGWPALFYAVWNDSTALTEMLIAAGARQDLRDNDGYTLDQIADIRNRSLR